VAHINLKPANILLFESNLKEDKIFLKISDFGLALRFLPKKSKEPKEKNELYRDPVFDLIFAEQSNNSTETKSKLMSDSGNEFSFDATKAHIWSLAIIMIEFRVGFKELFEVFSENYSSEKLSTIYVNKAEESKVRIQLLDLLTKMLKYDQKERLNEIQVCNHQ
jgi:serine/threonine protein kinase